MLYSTTWIGKVKPIHVLRSGFASLERLDVSLVADRMSLFESHAKVLKPWFDFHGYYSEPMSKLISWGSLENFKESSYERKWCHFSNNSFVCFKFLSFRQHFLNIFLKKYS